MFLNYELLRKCSYSVKKVGHLEIWSNVRKIEHNFKFHVLLNTEEPSFEDFTWVLRINLFALRIITFEVLILFE